MSFNPPKLYDWINDVDADPNQTWLVDDFILYDAAHQISGPATKGFKSWLAFALSLVVATGKEWCGLKPAQAESVLILETEGPRKSTAKRFKLFQKSMKFDYATMKSIFFAHRDLRSLDNPRDMDDIYSFIKYHNIKLVIVDTLAKSMRGDENSVQDVSRAMQGLDVLRQTGAAVVWLHHIGKPAEGKTDIDHETRGSSALAGFYDVHLAIRRDSEEAPYLNLTRRSNEAEESYYRLQWLISDEGVELKLEKTDDLKSTPDVMKDICVGKLLPFELYGITSLKEIWSMGTEAAKKMANGLVEEGVLEKIGKQKYRLK